MHAIPFEAERDHVVIPSCVLEEVIKYIHERFGSGGKIGIRNNQLKKILDDLNLPTIELSGQNFMCQESINSNVCHVHDKDWFSPDRIRCSREKVRHLFHHWSTLNFDTPSRAWYQDLPALASPDW